MIQERLLAACRAYLNYYAVALSLGFSEAVAARQAAFMWDQSISAPSLVYPGAELLAA